MVGGWKIRWIGALAFVLLLGVSVAAVDFLPLDEVVPGMAGVGKTVFQGQLVEEFEFTVVSVIPQQPPLSGLIMVEVAGDRLIESGGVSAGMSGSPMYIDGLLLGALGYGFSLTDHRIGLVTPAEPMLKLVHEMRTGMLGIDWQDRVVALPDGFAPVQTPVLLSGFRGRTVDFLRQEFSEFGIDMIPDAAGVVLGEKKELEAGSAFAIQLLRGDFQVASFGTVTHVEEQFFIGFGHPFLHRGDVEMYVTEAFVHNTISQLEFPFKVASSGPTAGVLYKDRLAGVAGVLDATPPSYIPVTISVRDIDRQQQHEYRVESVADESMVLSLVVASTFQAIDAALDRIGPGTARVRVEFVGAELSKQVVRENVFFDGADIAVWALSDLSEGLMLLLMNEFQEVTIEQIRVDVEIGRQRKTAKIEQASPSTDAVSQGETVAVEVQLRPYRQPVETITLDLQIPPKAALGLSTVVVRSGGDGFDFGRYDDFGGTWSGGLADVDDSLPPTGAESLEKLIDRFMERERNNEVVLEFYPRYSSGRDLDETDSENTDMEADDGDHGENVAQLGEENGPKQQGSSPTGEDLLSDPIRVRYATDYVISGVASFDIEITR